MRKAFSTLLLSAFAILSGCTTTTLEIPGVYVTDIQQGNIIDQGMIDQLRPNMNQKQVLYIMGSPMLVDPFHPQRWDYIYSEEPGGEARMEKRISLLFENDELVGVQGDFRPSSVPVIPTSKDVTVDVPKREIEKTLFEKFASLFGDD
ncbi:MAG: outer membrane protein assembly factor BamE [Gammaproteobacteria bacterium]